MNLPTTNPIIETPTNSTIIFITETRAKSNASRVQDYSAARAVEGKMNTKTNPRSKKVLLTMCPRLSTLKRYKTTENETRELPETVQIGLHSFDWLCPESRSSVMQ